MTVLSALSGAMSASLSNTKQDYFLGILRQAVDHCERCLGNDYQHVRTFRNRGDLVYSLQQKTNLYSDALTPILVFQLEPCLGLLQDFISGMAVVMPQVASRTGIVWGILDILMESTYRDKDLFVDIVDRLDETMHHLCVFRDYEWMFKDHPDLEETFVRVFSSVLVLLVDVLACVRENESDSVTAVQATISIQFGRVIEVVQRRTESIKQRARARALQNGQPIFTSGI